MTPEIWGVLAWFQNLGEQLPRELNVWYKHHSLVLELRLYKYLGLERHEFRSCMHCTFHGVLHECDCVIVCYDLCELYT